MEMLHYCYENNFSRIHTATPGPIGLAGLIIAHILKLPISATYYTSLPLYAQMLTDDFDIEELTWKFVLWYYEQMDVIYVPTQSVKLELTRKGIRIAGHCQRSGQTARQRHSGRNRSGGQRQ